MHNSIRTGRGDSVYVWVCVQFNILTIVMNGLLRIGRLDTEEQAINDHFTIMESLTLVLSQVGMEEISDRNAKTKSEKEAKKRHERESGKK